MWRHFDLFTCKRNLSPDYLSVFRCDFISVGSDVRSGVRNFKRRKIYNNRSSIDSSCLLLVTFITSMFVCLWKRFARAN